MITRKIFTYALLCCLFSLASATAWADDGFDLTANPESGSTVTELSSFTVCGYVEGMDLYDWDTRVEVVKDGVTVAYADYDGVGDNDEGYNEVSFAIDNEDWDPITLTEAGEYTIVIPAEYLKGGDEEAVYNKEVTITYTIGEGDNVNQDDGNSVNPDDYTYTVSPAAGELTEATSSITILSSSGMYVMEGSLSSIKVYKDGTLYTVATGITPVNPNMYCDEGETLELGTALSEAGEYEVVIPAGFFYYFVDGRTNDIDMGEIRISYTISEDLGGGEVDNSEGFDLTANPESGSTVTELSSFTVCGYVEYMDLYDWNTRVEVVKDGVTVAYADYDGVGENAEGYNEVTFTIDNEDWDPITLTEAGEYTIVIPAEYLKGGDEEAVYNKEVTITYTIGEGNGGGETEGFDLTFDPENGATLSELSSIKICGNSDEMDYGIWDPLTVLKDGEAVAYADWGGMSTNDDGYNVATYNIVDTEEWEVMTLTEEGTYTIEIPAGLFIIGDESSNAVTLTYTIGEGNGGETEGFDLTIDPENGSTLSQFNSFNLCGNSDEMDINDWDAILYVVKDGETVAIANNYGNGEDENGNNVFYYSIVDPDEWEDMTLTDEGTYTIEIPAGLFHIGDELSNAVTLTYTIGSGSSVNPEDYSYTVSPEEGELTEATSTITISCETGMYVVDGLASSIKVYKDGELYTVATSITPVSGENWMLYDDGETIELATALSEAGEYEVVIPAGFFYYFVDGRYNDIDMGEISIKYTIKESLGINSISVSLNEGVKEIYNLSGQRIQSMQNGKVNVVKLSDGSVKKIIVK